MIISRNNTCIKILNNHLKIVLLIILIIVPIFSYYITSDVGHISLVSSKTEFNTENDGCYEYCQSND